MIPPALIFLALVLGAKAFDEYTAERERRRLLEQEERARLARLEAERRSREAAAAAARRAAEEQARTEALHAEAQRREQRMQDPIADYISYTRLRTFAECPHKFYLKYILGKAGDEWRLRVASGKEFHSWLESQLKPHEGLPLPHEVLYSAPPTHRARAQALARRIAAGARIVGVEHEVHYIIGGVTVKGYVDLLYRDSDGTLVICDIKTGKTPKIHIEQLEMYSLLLLNQEHRVRLEFQLVDTDEVVSWYVTTEHHPALWEDLRANAAIIRGERLFDPIPGGHCSSCPFYDECDDAGISRGKPSELRLVQLRTAKRGSRLRR